MTLLSGKTLTLLLTSALFTLAGCGGSSSGSGDNTSGGGGTGTPQWVAGVFAPDSEFANRCVADPNGSELTEKLWLRSWSNDTYLWYDEIADVDPAPFSVLAYFDQLKTQELSPSGNTKDKFHFSMPTSEWDQLNQSGATVGYGAHFFIQQADGSQDRKITVTYVEPNSPASEMEVSRGYVVTEIDGVNVKDAADSASIAILNRGLFPETAGQQTRFTFQHLDKTTFTELTLTAQTIISTPVQNTTTIVTTTGKVGYLQFNAHIATAERGLFDAINTLSDAGVDDLVLDLRYNGGGLLAMAGQLGYMIAGSQATQGKIFERSTFNDKHPNTNPVTGEALTPMPFFSESLGFNATLLGAGRSLPSLNLSRLFVLTTANTCSASEALMNSLRGIDIEVIQIGDTTCGKPYGFYPTPNCGTTFFTVQFKGENNKGFGDYSDGFVPSTSPTLESEIPGCSLSDDFNHALGDTDERLLNAALYYRANGQCPITVSNMAKARPRSQVIDPGFVIEDSRKQNVLLNNRILTRGPQPSHQE
ncbi:S41 family peptidase [uncultured Shewanella sp.]|uniref:S41 family peptidase n=1 Tax=Shewanella atlantica TaxID=271099 RepID=UPI00263757A0|nr:S41 family peptidase [uncultured Shewanella sp.]